jgi:hypothetical protein
MDLSFGASSIPSIPMSASNSGLPQGQGLGKPAAIVLPRSLQIAAQVGQQVLMPTLFAQVEVGRIFVSRMMFPATQRIGSPYSDKRKRTEVLRNLKVKKSEASAQQSRGR